MRLIFVSYEFILILSEILNCIYLSKNQDFITGNNHFTKIVRTINTIISQITQPGKFTGVSTTIGVSTIIFISELYKKT
jgi:hypothetical protein